MELLKKLKQKQSKFPKKFIEWNFEECYQIENCQKNMRVAEKSKEITKIFEGILKEFPEKIAEGIPSMYICLRNFK